MIVGWSPHTGATANASPRAAIKYQLSPEVSKKLGAWRGLVTRDPAPELLVGDPQASLVTLKALRTKHRYSVATLSFAREEIAVDRFNAGDPELRAQVAQTLTLFFEVAYAGLPPAARLHPLGREPITGIPFGSLS